MEMEQLIVMLAPLITLEREAENFQISRKTKFRSARIKSALLMQSRQVVMGGKAERPVPEMRYRNRTSMIYVLLSRRSCAFVSKSKAS